MGKDGKKKRRRERHRAQYEELYQRILKYDEETWWKMVHGYVWHPPAKVLLPSNQPHCMHLQGFNAELKGLQLESQQREQPEHLGVGQELQGGGAQLQQQRLAEDSSAEESSSAEEKEKGGEEEEQCEADFAEQVFFEAEQSAAGGSQQWAQTYGDSFASSGLERLPPHSQQQPQSNATTLHVTATVNDDGAASATPEACFATQQHYMPHMDERFKVHRVSQAARKDRKGGGVTGRVNQPRLTGQWNQIYSCNTLGEVWQLLCVCALIKCCCSLAPS